MHSFVIFHYYWEWDYEISMDIPYLYYLLMDNNDVPVRKFLSPKWVAAHREPEFSQHFGNIVKVCTDTTIVFCILRCIYKTQMRYTHCHGSQGLNIKKSSKQVRPGELVHFVDWQDNICPQTKIPISKHLMAICLGQKSSPMKNYSHVTTINHMALQH